MRRLATRLALFGLALFAVPLAAPAVHASYEEFASLDVARQEEDDENLLDHVLARPPEAWLDEWTHARAGFRSSQGCFTSGQWYLDHELKVTAPLGDTAFLALAIREVSDDEAEYGWTQFDVRFPLPRVGLVGVRFRPTFDKSRQDVALLWDLGADTSRAQVQLTLGLEDVFNKFWALRQVRVGEDSEPYERHPYEPALRLAWRGAGPRVEVAGKWLTPSRKRFDTRDSTLRRREWLWGVKHDASLVQRVGATVVAVRFEQLQASSFAATALAAGDHHLYRRRWRAEGAVTRPVGRGGSVTARWFYQERTEVWRPPLGNATFTAIDRMPMLEGSFRVPLDVGLRLGFMRDRVTVSDAGGIPAATWGTRVETRAFFSVRRRFGRVSLEGTEGIELDREQYQVSFHHDKGFVHIQTTF